ncbi:MAG: SURF1 family protein [Pseudomonadota bacterium]
MNPNTTQKRAHPLPFVLGGGVMALMLLACYWQLERAAEKRADRQAFANSGNYTAYADGYPVRPYEALTLRGSWLADRQFLLDNIIVQSRVGHYVITPLETASDEPLVLVNRGFIRQREGSVGAVDIALDATSAEIGGRAGRLPRAGFKMGQSIPEMSGWPVHALYPVYDDLAAALGREVQPFVLLLDAGEPQGFRREWQPEGIGPDRHAAYAAQWFLMALVLLGLMIWHYRKRSFDR